MISKIACNFCANGSLFNVIGSGNDQIGFTDPNLVRPYRILRSNFSRYEYFVGIFLKFAYSGGIPNIGKHDLNRRNKLILEIGLSKGFAPTRQIISIFRRLIGQYFESGILFISLANLHGGKR